MREGFSIEYGVCAFKWWVRRGTVVIKEDLERGVREGYGGVLSIEYTCRVCVGKEGYGSFMGRQGGG